MFFTKKNLFRTNGLFWAQNGTSSELWIGCKNFLKNFAEWKGLLGTWKVYYLFFEKKINWDNLIFLGHFLLFDWAFIVHTGVSTTLKNTPPPAPPSHRFFQAPLLKSANCPSPLPFFRQFSFIYCFFSWAPSHPKNRIFQWTPMILKFFILNPIPSF